MLPLIKPLVSVVPAGQHTDEDRQAAHRAHHLQRARCGGWSTGRNFDRIARLKLDIGLLAGTYLAPIKRDDLRLQRISANRMAVDSTQLEFRVRQYATRFPIEKTLATFEFGLLPNLSTNNGASRFPSGRRAFSLLAQIKLISAV